MQAKHTCQYVGGFLELPADDSVAPPPAPAGPSGGGGGGLSLAAMVVGDVQECADLFLAVHGRDCGWDRSVEIAENLAAGVPYAM